MSTITKEQAQSVSDLKAGYTLGHADVAILNELARIALASLEAEPAIHRWRRVTFEPYGPYPWHYGNFIGFSKPVDGIEDEYYYAVPPAPVSVPAAMEMDDDFDSAFEHGKAVGWNAYRAAMLQGADGTLTNEGTMPVNQFKPVADLYGLTSPTGGETSFTFDAVEARDFIDGGWSCQEYVELGRFQEAITNHTEDKLAMVDHSGDSNNMVESVTTACELRDAVDAIRNSGIAIDGEKILAERDALNSPVIPDGWVMVPEEPTHEMLEAGDEQFGTYDVYRRMIAASPQQEA
ncbi:hypothetical protein [Enterobacter hormaechei]|uniref:hypothetical protein n=1 Tax=Enterobacter TaxID=547 RepID=UPI001867D138|nr:hypothetical protein [Enterobacter hormaechei]ELD3411129.1 hypothetical protein [Enterobacter hormaechei]MCU3661176.1 hypothetical protein [Enterobacter hormaechei subsp. steigerwaltii]MCU3793558.1 hypothetical protein [Enterobacter hormaechei subsp. steigerwaltii]HBM7604669.1 hypothetical protein [Enterobacter hormaechei subsp. xiangfangensis]